MLHFKSFLISVLLSLLLALTACSSTSAPISSQSQLSTSAAPTQISPTGTPLIAPNSAEFSFPVTITDALERQVTLNTAPQRIVSLSPSNTEILFAVGAGEQVVGVTKYCNYPAAATTREQIGGFSAKTISVENIVALKPDLVFVADEAHQPVIDALTQANIPVIGVDAKTFEDVYANIELIGRLTGHSADAAVMVQTMQQRVAVVKAKTDAIPAAQRLTVFWEVFDEPLITAGPATFIGQMIDLAGGVNIFADVDQEYPEISVEEVVKRNPAVIMGPESHGDKLTPEQVAARPGWSEIKAVKDGRIALVDSDIVSRPGPRLAEALETIAPILYPNAFNQ